MAPKKGPLSLTSPKVKKERRRRLSKSPGQTSASDPNPTATSPSASAPTGGATTTSLVPSSDFPSAPPTTTTTTQFIPSAPTQPTSLPSSSTLHIITTLPLSSAPPVPIQETHQELISCTSDGATATDLAGPSTAPCASAASTRTPTLLTTTDDFTNLFIPALPEAMADVQSVKKDEPVDLQEMVVALFGSKLDDKMVESERKMALEALEDEQTIIKRAIGALEKWLAGRRSRNGSGGTCGGSGGKGGGPDSGPGEGDGEGGGVSV